MINIIYSFHYVREAVLQYKKPCGNCAYFNCWRGETTFVNYVLLKYRITDTHGVCNSDVAAGEWSIASEILRKVEFTVHMVKKKIYVYIQGSQIEVQTPPH
jgi:hypothetical protein